jgi:HK97 family phage portal protein
MTSYAYRQLVMAHMALWGNAYSFIEYNNSGYPMALWPMLPSKMAIYRNSAGDIEYVYSMPSGEQRTFRRDQILHTMMITLDGVGGLSPIAYAREAVGLSLAMEEFGALYFANGTNIGGFVGTDKTLSPDAFERLKKQLNDKYEGLGKSHKLIILEESLKYEKVGIPPEDSQYLESRKFQALEIARIFRVPPHLIADLDRATFSNIEQQALEFISYSIRPWLVNLEQTYNWQLFTDMERKKYFVEHLIDGILRGDIQTRYNAYAVGKQNGWLSVNDIRELENLNPVDGGDMYMSPLNMIPSDKMEDYYKNVIAKDKSAKTETK